MKRNACFESLEHRDAPAWAQQTIGAEFVGLQGVTEISDSEYSEPFPDELGGRTGETEAR